MAILTEHEAGIWGATLATVQEQRERIAALEAALAALTEELPWNHDEADDGDGYRIGVDGACFHCGHRAYGHYPACPYVAAKALLEQQ